MFLSRMKVSTAPKLLSLSVSKLYRETRDAMRIVFTSTDSFSYKSGQFLTLLVTIADSTHRRCYSLCSSPYAEELPAIVVKRTRGGLVSNYLCDTLSVGQQLRTLPPMGSFTIEYDASRHRRYFFIAAGSGITPLFSLIKSILIRESTSEVHLIYANRSSSEIILSEGLNLLQQQHPKRLQLLHILKEKANKLPNSYIGRLQPSLLKKLLTPHIGELQQCHYFLCTPPSLRLSLFGYLKILGIPPQQIQQESFTADESLPEGVLVAPTAQQVTLRIGGKDYNITVKSGQSLLAAGIEADLDMPYSCQKGVCTTCRARPPTR